MSYRTHIYRRVMDEKKGYRTKKRCEFDAGVIDKDGFFLTGYIPRLIQFSLDSKTPLEIQGIPVPEWYGKFPDIPLDAKKEAARKLREDGPFPIVLRNDQKDMIRAIHMKGRGVIHSPTRSGKTMIMLATILFHLPNLNVLILTPSTDLVTQGIEDFKPFFSNEELGIITGDIIEPSRITFSNIQKFSKLLPSDYHQNIDIVICDECHHISSFKGTWSKVLKLIPAHMRLGFTATLPYDEESKMCLEGLLGPTIGEVKMETLIEAGVLAKPKLKIIKVPYNHKIHELEKFADVYEEGIVQNRIRNRMILRETQNFVDSGLTVLIMITRIEHGENLERMAKVMFPNIKLKFIHGLTERETRTEIKQTLTNKSLNVVITTVIWKEGITIPTLGAVINAHGGKEDLFPQQALGRGLGKAEGKEEVYLIDFFDSSHHFLIGHFGHRISLYSSLGWL